MGYVSVLVTRGSLVAHTYSYAPPRCRTAIPLLLSQYLSGTILLTCIIIIIEKDRQGKAGRGRLTPYQSEDPSPTLPTYRGKKEKGKIVKDKKGESN